MERIKEFFKRAKWDSIVIAILTILIGILCIAVPSRVADVLCVVFGISLIAMSIAVAVRYFAYGKFLGESLLVSAIVMLVLGIFCLIYPDTIQGILTVVFGLFIIVDSIESLADSICCAKAKIKGWIVLLVISLLTMALGVVVVFSTFETVMIFAGCSLIIEGVRRFIVTCVFSSRIKQAKKQLRDLDDEIDV